MAERLAAMAPSLTLQPLVHGGTGRDGPGGDTPRAIRGELALLEALTHEVRTPLATIRTLIRSLLRRAGPLHLWCASGWSRSMANAASRSTALG
jgi:hypothetical protein